MEQLRCAGAIVSEYVGDGQGENADIEERCIDQEVIDEYEPQEMPQERPDEAQEQQAELEQQDEAQEQQAELRTLNNKMNHKNNKMNSNKKNNKIKQTLVNINQYSYCAHSCLYIIL